MSKDIATPPLTRSWRDIPQPVKPRALSWDGRRRLLWRVLRVVGAVVTLAATGWAAWQIAGVWRNDPRHPAGGASAVPIGDHLVLVTDGVLDRTWLAHTLALSRHATLMSLDLQKLRQRLLATGQVATADVIRNFPATLTVHLSERTPLVRLMAEASDGARRTLLVARDGVVYEGTGYNSELTDTLPWLDGIKLVRRADGFAPIEGMATVAELLARAKLEAEPLYQTWLVVSIARLEADGEIVVRTRDGANVTFTTQQDFFGQLARLDLIMDAAARAQPGQPVQGQIDLSLGTQVPVRLVAPAAPSTTPAAAPAANFLSHLRIQIPHPREF